MAVGRKMDPVVRHRVMASIKKVNTWPEIVLRRALWRAGVRGWRCHVRSLPGTPDLVFRRWRLVVHVDGAWWHGHPDYFWPGRRGPYWDTKIQGNMARDRIVDYRFGELGWVSLRLWDVDILSDTETAVEAVCSVLTNRGWTPPRAGQAATPSTIAVPYALLRPSRSGAPRRSGTAASARATARDRG
jgi:DNA mismatch endonuclease (patch repair protein)